MTVAEVSFLTGSDGAYSLTYDDTLLTDHFLSMRPFKFLEGSEKLWCRIPYPYEIERRVPEGDLKEADTDSHSLPKLTIK